MVKTASKTEILLAQVVMVLLIAFTAFGVVWYGYVLSDAARGRRLPLKIYYPQQENPGGYPVVIFSHGSELSKDRYGYLGRFWAENGYVVIHITHLDDGSVFIKHGKLLVSGSWVAYTKEAEDAVVDSPRVNRPLDVSFVIDSLSMIAMAVPELGGRIDR